MNDLDYEQTKKVNDDLLAEGLHEAFCVVRDGSVEVVGDCNCRLRNPSLRSQFPPRIRVKILQQNFYKAGYGGDVMLEEHFDKIFPSRFSEAPQYLSLQEHTALIAEAEKRGRAEAGDSIKELIEALKEAKIEFERIASLRSQATNQISTHTFERGLARGSQAVAMAAATEISRVLSYAKYCQREATPSSDGAGEKIPEDFRDG